MSAVASPHSVADRSVPATASAQNDVTLTEAQAATIPERQPPSVFTAEKADHDVKTAEDPTLVTWDSSEDASNPQNWPTRRKWSMMIVISLFTILSPVSSSMVAPALPQMSLDLGVAEGSVLQSMMLSIFLLGLAIGPLLFAPLSEIFGRTKVLQSTNLIYLVFNLVAGFARTPTEMLIFRFLSGLGGGAPVSLGGGMLADMFSPEQRGFAMSLYSLAPFSGPAIGPLISGWISEKAGWRWIFYSTTLADFAIQLLGLVTLWETYAPKILGDKARALRMETANPNLQTAFERSNKSGKSAARVAMLRPLMFLATEPIVQLLGTYMAFIYGVLYLILTTFASLWTVEYGESAGIAGLHYLAIGLGFTLGSQSGARLLDRMYRYLKTRNEGVGAPEMRMPLMLWSTPVAVIGLLWYGWSAEYRVVWIVPDLGIFVYGIGAMGAWIVIQTYLIDTYTLFAASALAASTVYRSLLGFVFPLFANQLYNRLGNGWGDTLLALLTLVLGTLWPLAFLRWGHTLRSRSGMVRRTKMS